MKLFFAELLTNEIEERKIIFAYEFILVHDSKIAQQIAGEGVLVEVSEYNYGITVCYIFTTSSMWICYKIFASSTNDVLRSGLIDR